MIAGSTVTATSTEGWRAMSAIVWRNSPRLFVGKRMRDGRLGPRHAALGVVERVKTPDHFGQREQPALLRDKPNEPPGDAADPGFRENGVEGFGLLLRGEDRAFDEACEIGAVGDHRAEPVEIGADRDCVARDSSASWWRAPGHSGPPCPTRWFLPSPRKAPALASLTG